MWLLVVLTILYSLIFPTISFAHAETSIIKMTPNGFEPQTTTVDENSTVYFVNQDKVDHWPASNIHPTHDIYPEFDPKKPIEPGESWLFKPKRAGEWKYHDHLNPHIRGTLVVRSEKLLASRSGEVGGEKIFSNIFARIKEWFANFMDKFSASLMKNKQEDPVLAWNHLKEKYKGQGGSVGNIHDQAHLIGGLIYEKMGFSGLSKCSPQFAFGCYHGFLDKAFQKNLDRLNEAESACRSLGDSGPSASCIHGIGHGVASFFQTADLKKSLASCKRLSPSGLQYCFDGVFMEFERSAPQSFYSKENPYYPCDEVEKEFGSDISFACGRNQPTVLMDRFKLKFEDVVGICLKSPSNQFKTACFDALGFISVKSTSNPKEIISACQKIGVSEYILRCAKAAAGELIFQEVPGWQTNAPAVCNALPPNFQPECNIYIQDLIKQYGRVVSKDDNEYIRKELQICYGVGGKDDCYKKVAALFFNRFGLKKTLALFAQNEDYPEVYARCHEVTHFLSRSEYERLGSIAGVYAQCDSTCHGGCYHGTLEAYLKENTNTDFAKICGRLEEYDKPLIFYECMHGLGHAAMFITDAEVPMSLKLCDRIESLENQERCYSGVFMENSSSSTNLDHPSKFVRADDPYYPCNILEEKYLKLCYRYQSSHFALIAKHDWQKVASLCMGVPENYRVECFRTIGTNQVGFTQDINQMRANCDLMPSFEYRNVCVVGVISSMAYRFVGNSEKMVNFCKTVDEGYRQDCFRQIGASFLDWSSDKSFAKNECGKIPDLKGADWCLNVI